MRTAALLLSAALLACAHSTLPGTNISDNAQNRAVLDVFSKYRDALTARDAATILSLAAPTYFDVGDATHGLGPTDYNSLKDKLQTDFTKVTGVKLEATIKDLQIDNDKAHLDYFQVLRYSIATPSGEKWKSESDDARMKFVRVNGEWKIASGL